MKVRRRVDISACLCWTKTVLASLNLISNFVTYIDIRVHHRCNESSPKVSMHSEYQWCVIPYFLKFHCAVFPRWVSVLVKCLNVSYGLVKWIVVSMFPKIHAIDLSIVWKHAMFLMTLWYPFTAFVTHSSDSCCASMLSRFWWLNYLFLRITQFVSLDWCLKKRNDLSLQKILGLMTPRP